MPLKSLILQLIRTLHAEALADRLRFAFQYLKQISAFQRFKSQHPDFPIPPAYFLYETYALNVADYYADGKATAIEIVDLAKPYLDWSRPDIQVLDWGCGPARVVRHFPPLLQDSAKVMGTDYNQRYMDWNSRNISSVTFMQNQLSPPLDLPSNQFDLVYALSIITHLSIPMQQAWINELYRVVRKGGLLLITAQGDGFKQKLTKAENQQYDKGEVVIRAAHIEGHRVYAAFQPPAYMATLLQDFELLRFIPGGEKESIHGWQDTWLVRKPMSAVE